MSVLAVVLSLILVSGSLLLSMVEGGMVAVLPPTQTLSPTQTSTSPLPAPTRTPQVTLAQPTVTSADTETEQVPTESSTPKPTVTMTPLPPTNCPPPPGWLAIQTGPGDTLEELAGNYGTSVEALMQANCMLTTQLLPGTRLYVPPFKSPTPSKSCGAPSGWIQYIVQPGDTLYRLSIMFKVSIYALQEANCLTSTRILAGQRLFVPNLPTWTPTVPTPLPTRTPTPFIPTTTPTTAIPTPTNTPVTPDPTFTPTPVVIPADTPTPTNPPEPTATPVTPVPVSAEQKPPR